MRDELLNGEIFYTLQEARIIIEQWREMTENLVAQPKRRTTVSAWETGWLWRQSLANQSPTLFSLLSGNLLAKSAKNRRF
jgi:hypothetical protein